MSRHDSDRHRAVALYWDFENLHAGLAEEKFGEGHYGKPDNRFKVQEPLVDIQAIVELAASFGPIAINRAYCNWQYFGRYRDALLQHAVELVQLFPPGASAKNGADIRLCLDAMEDIARFSHIGTVVIVGGDSDFMPVAQKIKAAGRTLTGVGTLKATNRHWARSCHEFRYYDRLVEDPVADIGLAGAADIGQAAALLQRAMRLLSDAKGEPWVNQDTVWHMLKRLDPTFDPKDYGYANFPDMLAGLEPLILVRPGETVDSIRLR